MIPPSIPMTTRTGVLVVEGGVQQQKQAMMEERRRMIPHLFHQSYTTDHELYVHLIYGPHV
jgi:hypothetical protein